MPLTSAQLATLKAAIAANTATININGGGPVAINAAPTGSDANAAIAAWYNQAATPAYAAWNTATPIKAIRAATDLSKYTPVDNPPASGSTVQITNDALLYQNRALVCQLKQANAVFLIQGEGNVDATAQQFRQSFNDCMVNIPSGASGANQNAGWGTAGAPGAVRLAMQKNASNAEKLFSVQSAGAGPSGVVTTDPRGSTTNPDALVFVGSISAADVDAARNLP